MELLDSFADQAVIAIQNARLFNDTQAALARQSAGANILRTISASPTDNKPVFEEIVKAAMNLIDCDLAVTLIRQGDMLSQIAVANREGLVAKPAEVSVAIDPAGNFPSRVVVSRKMMHIPDWDVIDLPPLERTVRERVGMRSTIMLPLVHGDNCEGTLNLFRFEQKAFTDEEIDVAQSFCDQAVIALQNERLFNETQTALARQTASADMLRVISQSPNDTKPVFDEIVRLAVDLVSCDIAVADPAGGGSTLAGCGCDARWGSRHRQRNANAKLIRRTTARPVH